MFNRASIGYLRVIVTLVNGAEKRWVTSYNRNNQTISSISEKIAMDIAKANYKKYGVLHDICSSTSAGIIIDLTNVAFFELERLPLEEERKLQML